MSFKISPIKSRTIITQGFLLLVFILTLIVPFIKTFFLGEISPELQRQFILYFFIVQFGTPLINFGLGWSSIRKFIETEHQSHFKVSRPSLLFIALSFFINRELFLVSSICLFNAYFLFNLQMFRLKEKRWAYYGLRLGRSFLEVLSVFAFSYLLDQHTINIFLYFEFSVLLSISILMLFFIDRKVYLDSKNLPFSKDVGYMLIKTLKANNLRVVLPFLFSGIPFDKIFFILLSYEAISQFISINFAVQLLKNPRAIRLLLGFCLTTVPIQVVCIWGLCFIYNWDISTTEIIFILVLGNVGLIATAVIALIRDGQFNSYYRFVTLNFSLSCICIGLSFLIASPSALLLIILSFPALWEGWYLVKKLYELQKKLYLTKCA